jgi:hypothetical protein
MDIQLKRLYNRLKRINTTTSLLIAKLIENDYCVIKPNTVDTIIPNINIRLHDAIYVKEINLIRYIVIYELNIKICNEFGSGSQYHLDFINIFRVERNIDIHLHTWTATDIVLEKQTELEKHIIAINDKISYIAEYIDKQHDK